MEVSPKIIRDEHVRLLYKQAPLILIGSFLAAVVMVVLIWSKVPQQYLVLWSIIFTMLAIARGVLTRLYWTYSKKPGSTNLPWGTIFSIGAGLAGCLWGVASVVFYLPAEPEYILLITCLYAGLIASSGSSSGVYKPAFFYFAIPATVPFTIRHFMEGGEIYTTMGILMLLFMVVCGIFVNTYNKHTNILIRTQFKNDLLLEQLKEEKQIAEQAVVEKNGFLAAASHDLRQPLHALGLFVGVLRRKMPESETPLVENIEDSVEALNHLFNGLLDVSRLDAGVVTTVIKHVDLCAMLKRLYSEYLPMAEERSLKFNISCEDVVVNTDPVLLERILRNLISNAIDYTEKGQVSVLCEQQEELINVRIIDTGIGIPDSESEAIFSEYYQLNNPERSRKKGLGLGLAIVRRLCDLLDIAIFVDSTPGQGSTFSLLVKSGSAKHIDQFKPVYEMPDLANISILVIDDEETVLQGMHTILTEWGSKVVLAESASDAIERIGEQDFVPDIIFTDYRLRENKTGVEAINAVREELNANVPAVIITGDTSPERLREAKLSGFQLLYKPVTPDAIRQVLLNTGDSA